MVVVVVVVVLVVAVAVAVVVVACKQMHQIIYHWQLGFFASLVTESSNDHGCCLAVDIVKRIHSLLCFLPFLPLAPLYC